MELTTTYNVDLYPVFALEKQRVGHEFTVSYSQKHQQLRYALEGQGSLVVKYGRDRDNENREDFFYCPATEPNKQIPVYIIGGNGRVRRFEDEYLDVPMPLRRVIEDYYTPERRMKIGIDKAQAAAKKKHKLTFSKDR